MMKVCVIAVMLLVSYAGAKPTDQKTCSSPWTHLSSLLGGEAMKMGKMMLKAKMMGTCVRIQIPDEYKQRAKDCFNETLTGLKKEIEGRPTRAERKFVKADIKNAFMRFSECNLRKVGISIDNGIDLENLRREMKTVFTDIAEDTQTRDMLNQAMVECTKLHIKGAKNKEALMEKIQMDICMCKTMTMKCKEMNKSPGLLGKIASAALTLVDEPKCQTTNPRKAEMEQIKKECMKEVNDKWIKDGRPKKLSMLGTDDNKNIEMAFHFIKNFTKDIVIESAFCMARKMDFVTVTETNVFLNEEKCREYVNQLEFADAAEKDAVVKMHKDCLLPEDDPMMVELNNMIEMYENEEMKDMLIFKKMIMYRMQFDKCFIPKFVQTCGLNNEMASEIVPLLNFECMGDLIDDFTKKGGIIAIMHLMGALRENGIDVTKFLP